MLSFNLLSIFWFLPRATTFPEDSSDHIKLYIFWFLHQTTTSAALLSLPRSCISFDSYIKPQRDWWANKFQIVVYLLIPTSNHNRWLTCCQYTSLYIFWFLHQTTTNLVNYQKQHCCISFDSYIKPQPVVGVHVPSEGCISFDSYIKPQLQKEIQNNVRSCISFDSYIKPQP